MPTQTNPITTNTRITFMLTAEQSGTATIKFFATDSQGLSDSETVPVRVNTSPTIIGVPTQPVRLLDGAEIMLNVMIDDADADDTSTNLRLYVQSDNANVASVTAEGNDAIRTIKITGEGAGTAVITVTVNDGRGAANSVVSARFEVEVEANTALMIMAVPSIVPTMQLHGTTNVVVSVSDENFDANDEVVVTARSSSQTIVSVTTSEQTNNITTNTSITFVLTAEQSGTATIKFFAIDSQGLSDSETVLVRVNTPPQVLSVPTTRVATVGEPFELKTSEFFYRC